MKLNRRSFFYTGTIGFALTELVIAVGILAVISLALTTFFSQIMNRQTKVEARDTLGIVRDTIRSSLRSDGTWKATINSATNDVSLPVGATRNCIRNGTNCPAAPGFVEAYLNAVYSDEAGTQLVMNPAIPATANANRGFTYSGGGLYAWGACPAGQTFNPAPGGPGTGNDACPFLVTVRVRGFCPPGAANCPNPTHTIQAIFNYNPGPTGLQRLGSFLLSKYNFDEPRIGNAQGFSAVCQGFGGNYVAGPPEQCFLPDNGTLPGTLAGALPSACGPKQFLQRDSVSNSFRCVDRFNTFTNTCGGNTAISQLTNNANEGTCSNGFALANQASVAESYVAGVDASGNFIRKACAWNPPGSVRNQFLGQVDRVCPAGWHIVSGGSVCGHPTFISCPAPGCCFATTHAEVDTRNGNGWRVICSCFDIFADADAYCCED